jgi:hypothetical protein
MQLWIQSKILMTKNGKLTASKIHFLGKKNLLFIFSFEFHKGPSISSINLISYPRERISNSLIMNFLSLSGAMFDFLDPVPGEQCVNQREIQQVQYVVFSVATFSGRVLATLSSPQPPILSEVTVTMRTCIWINKLAPKCFCGSGSGIRCFLTPGSGMSKKLGSGSGIIPRA